MDLVTTKFVMTQPSWIKSKDSVNTREIKMSSAIPFNDSWSRKDDDI